MKLEFLHDQNQAIANQYQDDLTCEYHTAYTAGFMVDSRPQKRATTKLATTESQIATSGDFHLAVNVP